jgi:hypothetical protein
VTASVVGGILTITGDALANGVDISNNGFQSLKVTGLTLGGSATNINGAANGSFTANGVLGINVTLGAGSDSLRFGGTANGAIVVNGSVSIDMGAGNDTVTTANAANFLSIFGDLSITNGAGNCLNNFINLNVTGATTFDHTAGGNDTLFMNTSAASLKDSLNTLTFNGGTGFDNIVTTNVNFKSDVNINTAAGSPTGNGCFIDMFAAGTSLLSMGGVLNLTNGSGGAQFTINDYNIAGNATLSAGNSGSKIVDFLAFAIVGKVPTVKGNVSITSGGSNATVLVGPNTQALVINGTLSIDLSAANASNTTLNGLASVGDVTITGGGGADLLTVGSAGTGCNFNGLFTVNQGGGADTVRINGQTPTNFFGAVNVNQGSGNDSLASGNNGAVSFFAHAKFVGGGLGDINNTFQLIFANLAGGPFVPTFVHYHP